MRRNMLYLALSSTFFATVVHAQLIDETKTPELIPDDQAYGVFFTVMRTMPPPHWDLDIKMNYLKDTGLTRLQVQRIVEAADNFFTRIKPLDDQIKLAYDQFRGGAPSPEVLVQTTPLLDQKSIILEEEISALLSSLPIDAENQVRQHLDRVKRGTKLSTPNTKNDPLAVGYTAIAMSSDGFSLMATGVASTSGTHGHRAWAYMSLQSPDG